MRLSNLLACCCVIAILTLPAEASRLGDLNNLGGKELSCSNYRAAEKYFLEARSIVAVTAPGTSNEATILCNLALAQKNQDKFEQARKNFLAAIQILERLGIKSGDAAIVKANLAALDLQLANNLGQAEKTTKEALDEHKKTFGENSEQVAVDLNNLGAICRDQARFDEAESYYKKAIEVYKAINSDDLAIGLNNLGELYARQNKDAEAEEMLRQSINLSKAANPSTYLRATNSLAGILKRRGKVNEAEQLYLEAIKSAQEKWGKTHSCVGDFLSSLGLMHSAQNKNELAEKELGEALTITEKTLGMDHPSTAIKLNNLASIYSKTGRIDQAKMLMLRARTIAQTKLKPNDPDRMTIERFCTLLQTVHTGAPAAKAVSSKATTKASTIKKPLRK